MPPEPSAPLVVRLDIPLAFDLELEWFLDKRRREAPALPSRLDSEDLARLLWEKIALAAIDGWLRALDAYDADVLRCAYTTAEAPRRPLGRLAPIFARFASAEPGWPDAVHWRSAMRHVQTAAEVFRAALRAYARARGRGPCMLVRFT